MGSQEVHFARDAIRWLGVWLDSAPTLRESRHRYANRAHQAEAKIRRLTTKYGVPPVFSRYPQMAII